MAYEHISVARLNKDTADYIQRFDSRLVTLTDADTDTHKVFLSNTKVFDGLYVGKRLAEFCDAVLKINRHVKFGVAKRVKHEFIHGTNRQSLAEVWVYMPEHDYAMMRIGYADYAVRGSGDTKFGVYSRLLQNDKFSTDRDQYHMATSDNLERILKTVKKIMRPYTPHDSANVTFEDYQTKVHQNVWRANGAAREAKDAVMGLNDLRNELFALYDLGYEFASETLKDKIGKWKIAASEMAMAEAAKRDTYYVNVLLQGDELICNVISVHNVRKINGVTPTHTAQTFKMEDLPEDIAEKVATLGMVDNGHYVEGVGMKVSDTRFWIDRT